MAIHTHTTVAPTSVPTPITRRRLMAAATAAATALTDSALAFGVPKAQSAPRPDAALLALCAEFEPACRSYNGLWGWRVRGREGDLRGPNYIHDENERDAAAAPYTERMAELAELISDQVPVSLSGFQALARCIVFSAGDLRDQVESSARQGDFGCPALSYVDLAMVTTLLRGLTGGPITDAQCMVGPARFVADVAGAA